MREDYLWDGTGDPDPEVERLEQLLGTLRYREQSLARQPELARRFSPGVIAAAAVAVMVLTAGIWWATQRNTTVSGTPSPVARETPPPSPAEAPPPVAAVVPAPPASVSDPVVRKAVPAFSRAEEPEIIQPMAITEDDTQATQPSPAIPIQEYEYMTASLFVDDDIFDGEVSVHLEQVKLLLRSFKNFDFMPAAYQDDLAYEKRRARKLLTDNLLLRRDSQASGDIGTEELLNEMETYLLDIANLHDDPVEVEVETIKKRMKRNEIIAALQIHGY